MASPSLLALPRELRDQIWSNLTPATALASTHVPSTPPNWQIHNHGLPRPLSALSLTCTFLRNELLTFHYSHTTLAFPNTEVLHNFLRRIGPIERAYISKIHVFYWSGKLRRQAFELLAESRSLRRLWVGVSRDTMRGGMERRPLGLGLGEDWGKIGLEKIRGTEEAGVEFDFNIREVIGYWEVWHGGRRGRREYVEFFEKEIIEGVQSWRGRAYFGKGVVANFEKGMRELMTSPRIEEVPASNAGERNKDQADKGEE